jgi:primosomal protein N' (replication factor Y)
MKKIFSVIIPTPLHRQFDYLAGSFADSAQVGCRVLVPFGKQRKVVGIIWEIKDHSDFPINKLKAVDQLIDKHPILSTDLKHYCQWLSNYYHHPLGEVCFIMLPNLLRQNIAAEIKTEQHFRLSNLGKQATSEDLKRAKKQQALFNLFKDKQTFTPAELDELEINRPILKALLDKQLIETFTPELKQTTQAGKHLQLNTAQAEALQAISDHLNHFHGFLLEGVTGSGKTEVYLQAIAEVLKQDKQALVLVPEISLTPQTIGRFTERFGDICLALHSGLTNRGRLNGWLQAKLNQAKIIIGTRSAVFTPLAKPGIIIIDEEHDLSFKQQDGLRYSARDFALLRARHENVPVVLGSATPSLESLNNVEQKRLQLLKLPARAGKAIQPTFNLIDLRAHKTPDSLSLPLRQAMKKHLDNGQQVLLFLNRRGFSPVLMCHQCGWVGKCQRCNVNYTFHQFRKQLICHHCDSHLPQPQHCPECNSNELIPIGVGTQRIEEALATHFPNTKITRVDRDSTRKKDALHNLLAEINSGEPQILIGTQMLAKGHHFPNVTLAGILDADNGLFSSDFRALERTGQLITQVAGRAGRAELKGEVLIQTMQPDNKSLRQLIEKGYIDFSRQLLQERKEAGLPPFSYLTLFRAEALQAELAFDFLQNIKDFAEQNNVQAVSLLGPVAAPMAKRAGKYRMQLLLKSAERKPLHLLLQQIIQHIDKMKLNRKVRWSLDVDALEMY